MRFKLLCYFLALAAFTFSAPTWADPVDADAPDEAAAKLAPARDTSEARLRLPSNAVAKAGLGERLLLKSPDGKLQVVKLHCDLGVEQLVMLPTGELVMTPRSATTPTDKPFVPADAEAMKRSLAAAGFDKFKMEWAPPYLYVYASSEGFYLHTRSILESMYPGVKSTLQSWGLEPHDPEVPLVVIIMPSREAFDAYDKTDPEIAAYYNTLTNYVVLYEDRRLWEAAPEFALKQGAYIVAHEGVHQILHNTGIQQRLSRWPMWISEGLPEYFCPLKVSSRIVRTANAELPTRTIKWTDPGMVNDLRMYALLRTSAQSGEVAKQLVQASELGSREYALAWGLVHYLVSEKPAEFRAYLKDVETIEPLDPAQKALAGQVDPLFVKHFGDDFTAIETLVQQHLTSRQMQAEYRDPEVYQTHYVVKRVVKQARTFNIAMLVTTSPAAVREFKESEVAKDDRAKIFTKICKTRREAEFQVRKLQSL
ncbi:MAG: DUF1570 domain-containing protein [Pirellulales bacterium]